MRRVIRKLARGTVYIVVFILVVFGLGLGALETRWGKNQLRRLIVTQANQYLTATLEIDDLKGSILRGLELYGIRLSRDGQTIINIDEVSLSYSIRELTQAGTVIRRIRLVHPQVVAQKQADGRWNLTALVKREVRENERTGPRRPIEIQSIEVVNGLVTLKDPMTFGVAHVPGRYERLNLKLGFKYEPVAWALDFESASWLGGASDLTMDRLSGKLANGHDGWSFDDLRVRTAQSAFTLQGRVVRSDQPARLDLHVTAERFVFQEWASVLPALAKMPIDSKFDVQLTGPLAKLVTDIDLHSNGGAARGSVLLNTTIPGWHGVGSLDVQKLDLAPWFNNPTRRSDISGLAKFDVDLRLGRGVPLGTYTFAGPHAAYAGYEADRIQLRGDITERDWRIAQGTAAAYGARVSLSSGTIALRTPYSFHFRGAASGVDLRAVPQTIPVPHVESLLAFNYDVEGRFAQPGIAGNATFDRSEFIGAEIGPGTIGMIDTFLEHYTGEGDLTGIDLRRWGREMNVAWMQEPRYSGTIDGRFRVDGHRFVGAEMDLTGGGHLVRANLFGGTLTDAEVEMTINSGNLSGTYNGRFAGINPALALGDEQYAASLSGAGELTIDVKEMMLRTTSISDYHVVGTTMSLERSEARGVQLDSAAFEVMLDGDRTLSFPRMSARGPLFEFSGEGSFALGNSVDRFNQFGYDVTRADLTLFKDYLGDVTGEITTKGELVGPSTAIHATGDATVTRLNAFGVTALTTTGKYDVTFPWDSPADAVATVDGHATFLEAFGQALTEVTGTVASDKNRITADLTLTREDGLTGTVAGTVALRSEGRAVDVAALNLSLGSIGWRMLPSSPPPVVRWDDRGTTVTPLTLVDNKNGDQRIDVSGSWRMAGDGALVVKATHVFLDTLTGTPERPSTYGGLIDLDATLSGTRDRPLVTGVISVTEGRVRRLAYEKLAGRVDYADGSLRIDLRLDQAPGVWLTAAGTVPATLLDAKAPERPVDVVLVSSDVSLGLVEGVTAFLRDVTGQLKANVHVTGTNAAPVFAGSVQLTGAGFQIVSTGARYKNGNVAFELGDDRLTVSAFHLEDWNGKPLEVRGSLGTRELRVGDLEVDITTKGFEVLQNELGNVLVDANLTLRGQFDAPRLFGDIAIVGGQIQVDEVLSRALFQPYATEAIQANVSDVITALNPWSRLSLDIAVHSQNALRLIGENLTVSENAPLGLGSFNLRASGDIFLYKTPAEPLSVVGSLDSISGSYSFQGRRFELYPSSAVDFRGDLNPGLFISVNRIISGVETRVTISGTLRDPELRLSSMPPLDPSDILSLIVFNTSTNDLSAEQQRELAVRAGTLAVGFLTSSLTSALERSIGLDLLEIEPGTGPSGGAKVTIGQEIAPGLVARFSRQFGADEYDEATIEYYISRILQLRATFSDAGSLITRSPFRRIERTGVDLLLFFSF